MDTKNLTILFSDMVSFTQTTANLSRQEILELIEKQDNLISPIIKEFRWVIVKTIGDAYLVTFESTTNALLCAIKIQEQIYSKNRDVPKKDRFKVRIALSCGDVTIKDDDVFGTPVNIASRVQSLAKPGEVYLTEAVFLALNRSEIAFTKLGKKSLKGIPRKIVLYKVDMQNMYPSSRKNYLAVGFALCLLLLLVAVFLSPILMKDRNAVLTNSKERIKDILGDRVVSVRYKLTQ